MFLSFFTKIGATVFAIYAKPIGEWEGRTDILVDKEDMKYMASLEKKYRVVTHQTPGYGLDFGCIAVKRMFTITQYGDVQPCPYINLSLGNLFQESLDVIIKRGMNIPWIYSRTCLIGEDRNFIKNYLECIKGKELPVDYKEMPNL
jgi:MoaA/NifB/PqqE/SkfB family radical SAM enzyme